MIPAPNRWQGRTLIGAILSPLFAAVLLYCWFFLAIPVAVFGVAFWAAYVWLPETLTPLAAFVAVQIAHGSQFLFLSGYFGSFDATFDVLVTVVSLAWLLLRPSCWAALFCILYDLLCLSWFLPLLLASRFHSLECPMYVVFVGLEVAAVTLLWRGFREARTLIEAEEAAIVREGLQDEYRPGVLARVLALALPLAGVVILTRGTVITRLPTLREFLTLVESLMHR